MRILVNGAPMNAREGITLSELVRELELDRNPLAVELNLRVVPRDRHGSVRLSEGDRLEIVTLVGGG